MISAESAIRVIRRDLTVSSLVRGLLLGGAGMCLLAGPMYGPASFITLILMAIAAVWIALSYRSARGSSLAADSPSLIASGKFDEAEDRIEKVLRSFSLFRTVKLMSLHHLAVLRHAQRNWTESALLSRALLSQRLGSLQPLAKTTRLMLTDSLLELNDLRGAYDAIALSYQQRLTLDEAITLLVIQLDYESRIGAWENMMQNVSSKAQLAELMPPHDSARAQALLALAAMKTGRTDWADWHSNRARLLMDVNVLVTQRPLLAEVMK